MRSVLANMTVFLLRWADRHHAAGHRARANRPRARYCWAAPAEVRFRREIAAFRPERYSLGSGSRPRAAYPFIKTDAAETRLAQRHQRVLFDPTAEVTCLGVFHHLAPIAHRLQIAS